LLEDQIKERVFRFFSPKILKYKGKRSTANILTVLSAICSLTASYFFFTAHLKTGGMFVLLDYLFDGLDGLFAKASGKASNVGFILDHISDFVLRRIWYFALAASGFISYELVALMIFSLSIGVFLIDLAMIKNLRIYKWSTTWADWLIIPGLFTGNLVLFFQIMISIQFVLFFVNLASILYLNK
jgi:phosphatidylglycerophosphate synthase